VSGDCSAGRSCCGTSPQSDAQLLQLLAQLIWVLHLDGVHSKARGGVQVQRAIVDETALLRWALGDLEGQAVDCVFRLAQSHKAGACEKAEDFAQTKGLNAEQIQFLRFIVDGRHQVLTRSAQVSRQLESLWIGLRQREHERLELIQSEGSWTVENRALEIFLQGDFAALEGRRQHLVAAFEFDLIQIEVLESVVALLVVPCIAEQHAANVPENSADSCQGHPPKVRWSPEDILRRVALASLAGVHGRVHVKAKAPTLPEQDRGGLNYGLFNRRQCAA